MLETKLFEIRDDATFIPAIATRLSRDRKSDPESHWLIGAAGYGNPGCVFLAALAKGPAAYDPYAWLDRSNSNDTMHFAHLYIQEHWDELPDGAVVDARVQKGEATEHCESDRKHWYTPFENAFEMVDQSQKCPACGRTKPNPDCLYCCTGNGTPLGIFNDRKGTSNG